MSSPAAARILVVDDDPLVARTLVDLLAFYGHPADRAEDGERALETLARGGYDLVLLDVRLPGISGFETCQRIRTAYGASLPVILLTAYGDAAAFRAGQEAGADDFLTKPVDTPALILKVRAFLRFKTLHDETLRSQQQAQARLRDMAVLHEIGRDWSLIGSSESFYRMVTERLAGLIGARICVIALYDPATRTIAAALPVHGLRDELARRLRYTVKPEYRTLWNFRSGRPYMSNRARSDPRLIQEIVELIEADSLVMVPMQSEGKVLGVLVAANKPGGFTDGDVQLLSIFAGPAATFLRSRQIFEQQRRHAARLERLADLMGALAATTSRAEMVELTVSRLHRDLGYRWVAFHAPKGGGLEVEAQAGGERPSLLPEDPQHLKWAQRGTAPLQRRLEGDASELAIPVRAGEESLGLLLVVRSPAVPFPEEEVNLLQALGGQLAVALQKAAQADATARLARQMATLYDLGLETSALRDLRPLFNKASEEAGRLIGADHASVFRLDEASGVLRVFTAWARDPSREPYGQPTFQLGEGIAGRVARDWVPALVNDAAADPNFVTRGNPVARIACVPLTYYDREREAMTIFGVLNATRRTVGPPFSTEDLEYLTRFAGQLSIAVANSMAFQAERERSEQLALVNTLIREIAGLLSRERILETAVRRIQEAFRFPVVMIVVADPTTRLNRIAAAATREPRPEGWGSYPMESGLLGRVLRDKKTVLAPDVALEPDYVAVVPTTRSQVAVPIFAGGEVVAILNVESDVPRAFDRGHVITLETLADGIGIILRNAELYEAVERSNAKLVELDRMKSELVNIVAHDFRAPLAGVLGYAEVLEMRREMPEEERLEAVRGIIQSATHMSKLVDKTLKTTRLETGQFPFEFALTDVAAVVRAVLARVPPAAAHPLVMELPEEPLPCWADRDRLEELVENLVSNAVKYSPDGGEVRVRVEREGETCTVCVSDRGIGIAVGDRERLFRPFSRVRNRRTAQIEGSGLGLYICERIVRAHGGRLWVESHAGEGSTFCFQVPLFGLTAQVRGPLVLVAAADEGTRRELERVARELGFETYGASDGVEALEAAVRLVPAAAILDRILPKLRAEQVAERLKDHEATAHVPLFALGEEADLGPQAELFVACLPKPLSRDALRSALEAVASRARPV